MLGAERLKREGLNPETVDMLNELADLLDTLPRKRFDYALWVGDDWKGDADLSCGTVACAAGWATTLPSFRDKGLRLSADGTIILVDHNGLIDVISTVALCRVLDLPSRDIDYLFVPGQPQPLLPAAKGRHAYSPGSHATAKQVARHIRRYLKLRREEAE